MRPIARWFAAVAVISHAAALAQTDPFVRSAWQIVNADLFLMALDANGDVYVAGRTNEPGFRVPRDAFQPNLRGAACGGRACTDAVIAKIRSSDGQMVAATFFGGTGEESPTALHVDKVSGAVYIAGVTTSRAAIPSEGAFQTSTRSASTSFVVKLNSTLTEREFGTFLGGNSTDRIAAMAVDNQGSVYIAGVTESREFPTTPGAFRTTHAAGMIFITRLNSTGTALIASTFLGQGSVAGLSLDSQGNVVITGTTTSESFPVTANAYQTRPRRTPPATDADGFIARVPTGLNAPPSYSTLLRGSENDSIVASGVDESGNVYVTGTSFSRDLPLTLKDAVVGSAGTAFVAKFSANGIVYSRALRGNNTVSASAIEVNRDGTVNVSGFSSGTHFPTTAGAFNRCVPASPLGGATPFYTRLDRDGGFLYSTLLNESVYESRQWFVTLPSGDLYTLGFTPPPNLGPIIGSLPPPNTIRRRIPTAPAARIDCVVNAATYAPAVVAPGLIITIFGSGIGPAGGTSGTIENGRVTTTAGGVRVLFDGVAAPILYAGQDQVNAIVPLSLSGRGATMMAIEYAGATVPPAALTVRPTHPGVFRLGATEQAVILNEDNTVNTPENPAARGSIITFWITGFGSYEREFTDGTIPSELSSIRLPVRVTLQNQAAELLYSGAAPGLVVGAAQVNARVPATTPVSNRIPLSLTIGTDVLQNAAFLSVK